MGYITLISRRFIGSLLMVSFLVLATLGLMSRVAYAANTDAVGDIMVTVLPNPGDTAGNESEYFVIEFSGSGTLNLDGWTVSDTLASENLRHTFSLVNLTSAQSYKVCGNSALGSGCDLDIDSGGNTVWNNTGDSLLLRDEMGTTVLEVSWGTATEDTEYSDSVSVDYTPSDPPSLEITNPATDFEVISGVYEFTANYLNGHDINEFFAWEIYAGTCDSSTGALFGNVDNLNDPATFTDGVFSAFVDVSSLAPGNYCFSVDPVDDDQPDLQADRTFVIDSGYPSETAIIEGYKWNDANGNGLWDEGEEGLPNWTIILSDKGEEVDRTTTDEEGHYSFAVTDGFWVVSEERQGGWEQTAALYEYDDYSEDRLGTPHLNCEFDIFTQYPDQPIEVLNNQEFQALALNSLVTDQVYLPRYRCDFGNQEVEEEETSSSNSSTGTKPGVRNSLRSAPAGEVLGASTSENQGGSTTVPQCGRYLFDYMRAGIVTYAKEVMKLQTFLTGQGFYTPVTGIFDATTEANVRLFQTAHLSDVLTPWGLNEPTGYVYKTTRWKINNIVCPGSEEFPNITDEL